MEQYISKSALVAELKKKIRDYWSDSKNTMRIYPYALEEVIKIIDTLEVKEMDSIVNPYDVCIQYPSIEAGIKAHAEDYSWNIESELFQQLTSEQQKLWRKEIEQACISGGYSGLNLARDPRYKENFKVKEVDLEKEIDDFIYTNNGRQRLALELDWKQCQVKFEGRKLMDFAKHFFELGMQVSKAQKGE